MNQSKEHRTIVAYLEENSSSLPPFMKLIPDCWTHIFGYLPVKDILVLSQTCKQMIEMVGHYIREYHPELMFNLISSNECEFSDLRLQSDFYPFIGQLYIGIFSELDFIWDVKTFESLNTIIFDGWQVTESQIECMKNVLRNVETIDLNDGTFTRKIFEQLANYCPKLKNLIVHIDADANLFLQHFPMLDTLKYQLKGVNTNRQIDELKLFLEKHWTLNELEVHWEFLWINRDVLRETNCELERLSISLNGTVPFDQFFEFLKTLYECGFFKALQLSFNCNANPNVKIEYLTNSILTLPALEGVSIGKRMIIDLNRLINLKELYLLHLSPIDSSSLPKSLVNLKCLSFSLASFDIILPFICQSKRLKTIRIGHLLQNKSLDLFTLNEERKKLVDACKVVIFLAENACLFVKWKIDNVNMDLVKIRRG